VLREWACWMTELPGPNFDESVDDVTLAAMRAVLSLVTRAGADGDVTPDDVLAALTMVHRTAGTRGSGAVDRSVPAHEVDRLVGHCLAAGFHIVRVLAAHVEARWGIPAETLLQDFEREMRGDET
jgi:hypothetical protein